MRKTRVMQLPLLCALTLCGCASNGPVRLPPPPLKCPAPQPPPAGLMVTPSYEQQVRVILFDSPPSATRKSEGSSRH